MHSRDCLDAAPGPCVCRVEGGRYDTALQQRMAESVLYALSHKRMTQKQLAVRCDLSEKHVSQVLTGKAEGSFETWQSFARVLSASWDVSLRWYVEPKK